MRCIPIFKYIVVAATNQTKGNKIQGASPTQKEKKNPRRCLFLQRRSNVCIVRLLPLARFKQFSKWQQPRPPAEQCRHIPGRPQETHGLCRFRKSPKPGPQEERSQGLPIHCHGRRSVFPLHPPTFAHPPSKANPASESPHSLTLFSTRLFTLPSSLFLPPPSTQRQSPSRASVQVCPVRVLPLLASNSHPSDIEENGVRLHLTVVDTPGFGDFVNNDDRCRNFRSRRALLDT